MRHPIEKYNQEQARVLASLPNDQREFWARQFRIGNASYCYQHQFNEVAGLDSDEPNEDLLQWVERNLLLKGS